MVSVQRSISIGVPVHTLYNQLTQFEDYPQFMHDIESVEQVDDTHLHWRAKTEEGTEEWDAVITEQVPDKCIAWHTERGPSNAGKVELQPVGPAASRLTLTVITERDPQPSTPAGDIKAEMSEKIWEDLARLRNLIESRGQESGAWRGEVHDAKVTMQDRSAERKGQGDDGSRLAGQESGPIADLGVAQGTGQAGNMAGRGGIDEVAKLGSVEGMEQGDSHQGERGHQAQGAIENLMRDRGSPGNPVPASGLTQQQAASSQNAAQRIDPADAAFREVSMPHDEESDPLKADNPPQSDYSLSQGEEGDQFSVAEEVSFDQQSDKARHVGQLPQDDSDEDNTGVPRYDAIGKAKQRGRPEPEV